MKIQFPPETPTLELNQFLRNVYSFLSILPTFRQIRVDADYTAKTNDYYIGVTDTAAPRTVNLPALANAPIWIEYVIKDESGGAGANSITIEADGAETIDGAANKVVNTDYGVVRLIRSPTEWFSW